MGMVTSCFRWFRLLRRNCCFWISLRILLTVGSACYSRGWFSLPFILATFYFFSTPRAMVARKTARRVPGGYASLGELNSSSVMLGDLLLILTSCR